MNYGSTESQNDNIERQSSIATTSTGRRRIERRFLLPGIQVFAYSVGHIHNDICSAMWFTYLLVFFEEVLGFSATTSGLLLLIGQIADGLATPIVGIESDRDISTCHAYGKRKTWHLIGTILSMFTFPFIFQPCYGGESASRSALIFYYSMLIIVFQFAWAMIQINHMSMATDLSPYSCERVKLTARRSSFTVISNILVYSFTWLILHVSNKEGSHDDQFSPNDKAHFRLIVVSLVSMGLMFSVFFHIFVREKPHNVRVQKENEDVNSVDYSDRSNHLQWKHWFRFKVFYQVACLYMVSRLIVNITQAFITLYLQHSLGLNKESAAYIPLVIYCSGFVGSILVENANKRFTNIQIFFVGSLVSLSAFVFIFFGTGQNYSSIYIYLVSVLLGLSGQTININSQSVLNDMIGQNTASSGVVFGIMSFLDKFSNGTVAMIIQVMRESVIFKDYTPFLRYALSYVCGGASIVAIIILVSLKNHNFEQDLCRNKLNKSRSYASSSTNTNIYANDCNQPIRQTNDLVECGDEEQGLLSSFPN